MKIVKYFLVVVVALLVLFIIDIVVCCVLSKTLVPSVKDFADSTFVEREVDEMDVDPTFNVSSVETDAKAGDAGAQYVYGCYLLFGRGVPQDKEKGVEWIRKAADQNNPFAQGAMAYCYFKGEGISKNKEEARKWAEKAESSGHPVWTAWTCWEQEEFE